MRTEKWECHFSLKSRILRKRKTKHVLEDKILKGDIIILIRKNKGNIVLLLR